MNLFRFFAYANWYIAGAAALLASTTWLRFGFEVEYDVVVFVFLATLLLYTFQRILKFLYLKQHGEIYNWCVTHYKYLVVQGILSLLSLVPLVSRFPVIVLYSFLTAGVFSLLYLFVSPLNLKLTGLRHLPFVKSVLTAIVWSVVTALIPLLNNSQNDVSETDISWVYIEHLLFIYVLIIPFDIRDMQIDSATMKTLPQLVGAKAASLIGAILLLTFLLISELADAPRPLPVLITFSITAIMLLIDKNKLPQLFYFFVFDGLIYLYALLFWLACVWVN